LLPPTHQSPAAAVKTPRALTNASSLRIRLRGSLLLASAITVIGSEARAPPAPPFVSATSATVCKDTRTSLCGTHDFFSSGATTTTLALEGERRWRLQSGEHMPDTERLASCANLLHITRVLNGCTHQLPQRSERQHNGSSFAGAAVMRCSIGTKTEAAERSWWLGG